MFLRRILQISLNSSVDFLCSHFCFSLTNGLLPLGFNFKTIFYVSIRYKSTISLILVKRKFIFLISYYVCQSSISSVNVYTRSVPDILHGLCFHSACCPIRFSTTVRIERLCLIKIMLRQNCKSSLERR